VIIITLLNYRIDNTSY